MAVETDADRLAAFFNTSEFAVTATIGGKSVAGLYDDPYIGVESGGIVVASSEPRFTCRKSDVSTVAVGDTVNLTAAGYGSFRVRDVQRDGQGVVVLELHEIPA
ncbi:MAG: hypothetical protein KJO07_24005 [Deltaproteobacteria bacterium]|nr:hypothetical protein [Deltaproteobacteria bacterium]